MKQSEPRDWPERRAGALWGAAWSAIPRPVARRLAAGGAALEIGCGKGLACLALAEGFPAARITGHDRDERAIAEAVALARVAGLDARLQFGVADSLRLPRSAFDLVAAWGILEGPAEPGLLLNAIRNALVPEGTCLLLETPTSPTRHGRRPGGSLRSLARAAGFSRCRSHSSERAIWLIELGR